MKKSRAILVAAAFVAIVLACSSAQESKAPAPGDAKKVPAQEATPKQYSGMYTFLKDGEFVQITVEDEGKVTGSISRYAEGESDKGAFVDQFFRSGKLEGNKLTFTTETVHGVWFEFKGTVERGEGKNAGDEAYYVLKGTLIENATDTQKKATSHSNEVVLKMFPKS